MSRSHVRRFAVTTGPDDVGSRADVVLARHTPGLSRRVVRRAALAGGLRVDGHPSPPSTRVVAGTCIELVFDDEAPPLHVNVLRVTEDLIYVDKPEGIHTVALSVDEPNCLSTWVADRYPECRTASIDPRESGALHRLDAGTSGVVAFARHRHGWEQGRAALTGGGARKRYLALCPRAPQWPPPMPTNARADWLRPEPGFSPLSATVAPWPQHDSCAQRVCAPIGSGSNRNRVWVREDGQPSCSVIRPLSFGEHGHMLYAIDLETGRRHQARVHLAWLGLPIAGDTRYGSPSRFSRLMLHAVALDLSAVFAGEDEVNTTSHIGIFGPFVST